MENTIKSPRFIQNKPCGIDKFEGGSQKRLVSAITKHINNIDNLSDKQYLSRIIGLEGDWGVGKSNVIKLLQTSLPDNKYYVFEYDAWGNQEDLQRRSLLELLTEKLITDSILTGNTTVRIKGGGTKEVTWDEKLKLLLARKSETITEKYPRISNSMATSVLVAILTPIFVSISIAIKPINPTWWSILLSIFISLLPIIGAFAIWFKVRNKDSKYKNLDYLLAIYNDKIEKDICYETISEEEPTVVEFKSWMQDISIYLGSQNKKLIIIFDNMDRLPADKVKELWSSIHTFFAEVDNGFENVWVIIPYDEKHLACAFGDDDNPNTKELTRHFISKTFLVVYRVAPPVITDLKTIFDELFSEAFGDTEKNNQETVNRIFRIEKPNATVREIIVFINQLVALKSIWEGEISIQYMAIFSLQKDKILEDPINQILSGGYLTDKTKKFFSDEDTLQKNISALVYEVSIEHAEQIPLNKYISSCLNKEEGYDINTYSIHKHFGSILDDVIKDTDSVQTDLLISIVSNLDTTNIEDSCQKIISQLWKFLAKQRMKMPIPKLEFEDTYKNLLLNVHDEEIRANLVKKLCKGFQKFPDFKGDDYFVAISNLDEFLQDNKIEVPIELTEIETSPEIFIDYVWNAEESYPKYKLKTNSVKLDEYYVGLLPDSLSKTVVFSYLKSDAKYSFPKLLKSIEELLRQGAVSEKNFKELFNVYKIIAEKKVLPTKLNVTTRQNLLITFTQKIESGEYCELVAMTIASGANVAGNFNDNQVKLISDCIEHYSTYGDLLINCVSWNIPVLNQVLKSMTIKQKGITLSIDKVLPLFISIKNKISVSDEELIKQLNRWERFVPNAVNKNNIKTMIPDASFYQHSIAIQNNLTKYLNEVVLAKLSEISSDELYNNRTDNNYYWNIVIKNFINSDLIKQLPDNLTDFGKRILKDIANGSQNIPIPENYAKIIGKLDKRKTKSTIKDIRDDYFATRNISSVQFKLFEEWFELQGDFKESAIISGSVVRRIIRPIINDSTCFNIILSKSEFYSDIINNAGDEAIDLKEDIRRKLQSSSDTNLIAFAESIGVEKEEKK